MNAGNQVAKPNVTALVCSLGILIGLLLLVAGGFMTRDAWRDQAAGGARPQRLALADLLRDGPGANRHVEVRGFTAKGDYLSSAQSVSRADLFLVLSPDGDPEAARGPRKYPALIAVVHGSNSREDTLRAFREKSFTGMFEEGGQLTSEGERLLRASHPGLDLTRVAFLDVRDYRGTPQLLERAKLMAAIGLGLFAVSVGGFVVLRPGKETRRVPSTRATGPMGP